jgi:putative ABC transport system permease protein
MRATLADDLKHAGRGLLRDRAFTLVAVLSIALGVGANSAIFSLVDQLLFRLLPVREPHRLVLLTWRGQFVGTGWGTSNLLPHPLFRDLQRENGVFEGMFARYPTSVHFSAGGPPEPVKAELVSGTYFPVLGVGAALGRTLDPSDDQRPGEHPVVVLSYDHWRNRLGGDTGVLGGKVLVNNHPMTVVGVAAAGFRGIDRGEVPALFVPLMMKRVATPEFDWLDNRRGRFLHVFGRLKAGMTPEQAQAGLQPWFKAMLDEDTRRDGWPSVSENTRRAFLASTLQLLPADRGRSDLSRAMQRPLLVLAAATTLVLLLACLNVAGLCLARAVARQRDTAVRSALGASAGRIVRQQLAETALLAVGGGALGALLAPFATQALIAFLPPDADVRADVDVRVFVFTMAVATLTGLAFGLLPALRAGRTPATLALKERSSTVSGGVALRKALLVGQIALALVLLIGAGLFVRTLASLRAQGPGYPTANLLTFEIDPGRAGLSPSRSKPLLRALLARLRGLPEVERAGLSVGRMLSGGSWNGPLTIEAQGRSTSDREVHFNAVSPGFLATLGAPIVAGRDFDEHDAREEAGDPLDDNFRVAIVNQKFVERYLPGKNPLGARLGFGTNPDVKTTIEVVGVVKTFRYRGLREEEEQVLVPAFESTPPGGSFYVRTRTRSEAAFGAIRAAVQEVDPGLTVVGLRTLDDQLDRVLLTERMLATLASAFAVLATVLAVIGLYGVMSFVVTRRTREIGIRIALGASRRMAVGLVLRDAALLVAGGLAIALPAVWALTRLLESQLFGVRPMDAATLTAAAFLITLVALLASAVPARRASSVNPTVALRAE